MVRAEPRNNCTAVIDTNHSTMFTLVLDLNVICEQRRIQFELQNSPSRVLHLMAKYKLPFSKSVKSDQTKFFDIFRIFTLKQQTFSQSDPVLIRPKLASVLIQSDPVLIRTHLWCSVMLHYRLFAGILLAN